MNSLHEEILSRTEKLVFEERRINSEILECLQQIESKMIYAEMAYSSLYDFCVKHLKYSEGAAHRRISAMRLLKTLPEKMKQETILKIESGSISVSNLSLLHGFLKTEKKESKKIYSNDEKTRLIHSIENCSKLEVEKKLATIQPKIIPSETKRVLTQDLTEISFVADQVLMDKLKRAYELSSHSLPDTSMAKLIHKLADDFLKKNDPLEKLRKRKL